jgi:hypothetical protein
MYLSLQLGGQRHLLLLKTRQLDGLLLLEVLQLLRRQLQGLRHHVLLLLLLLLLRHGVLLLLLRLLRVRRRQGRRQRRRR